MKPIQWLTIVLFGLAFCGLAGCQPNQTQCQPISNPSLTPDALKPWQEWFRPNIKIDQVCTFTGRVNRGQVYKHQITRDLVFCLLPVSDSHKQENTGWKMMISDTSEGDCGDNFAPIVNPPYHGNLLFDIQGWNFRNKDNTGENDGSVNAPQKVRGFTFLLSHADYTAAVATYQCANWGIGCSAKDEPGESMDKIFKLPRSEGVFTITDLKLGNLIPNDEAWIEKMEFSVKIYLPSD